MTDADYIDHLVLLQNIPVLHSLENSPRGIWVKHELRENKVHIFLNKKALLYTTRIHMQKQNTGKNKNTGELCCSRFEQFY